MDEIIFLASIVGFNRFIGHSPKIKSVKTEMSFNLKCYRLNFFNPVKFRFIKAAYIRIIDFSQFQLVSNQIIQSGSNNPTRNIQPKRHFLKIG